jgi:hypothetical protein
MEASSRDERIARRVASAFKEKRGTQIRIVASFQMPSTTKVIREKILELNKDARIVHLSRTTVRECPFCSKRKTCKECNTVSIDEPARRRYPEIAILEEAARIPDWVSEERKNIIEEMMQDQSSIYAKEVLGDVLAKEEPLKNGV